MASTARLSPTAWLSPSPIIATPPPFIIVLTSLKSRFTRPGFVMISVRPLIDRIRTSSANLNTRSEPCTIPRSSSSASRAASSPICGRAPAPRPFVIRRPRRTFFGEAMCNRCCASVLQANSSAPTMPSLYTREIVLQPPPPSPMILMLVRILLSISSSSASTRLSSNAGALPSRASTSSSMEFIPSPAVPASSSHPARWARIRGTLFKSCRTSVCRIDKRDRSVVCASREEGRRGRLADRGRRGGGGGDHHDPVHDLPDLERATEGTHLGKGSGRIPVQDGDLGLRDARFAQQQLRQRHVDDYLSRLESRPPRDPVLDAAALLGVFEGREGLARGVRQLVAVVRYDTLVQLAVFQPQRYLPLKRPLVRQPPQEFVVDHLLELPDRGLGTLDRPSEHLLRDPDRLVEVDRRVHEPARDEHPLERRQALSVQGDFAVLSTEGLQQTRKVDHPVRRAGVVGIPHQVVDLVCVHRAVDYLREVSGRLASAAGHQPRVSPLRRAADQGGDRVGIDAVLPEDLVNPEDLGEGLPVLGRDVVVLARDDPLRQVHVVHGELAAKDMLERV